MKHFLLVLGLILLTTSSVGCSKSNEPGNVNAKSCGSIQIDRHKVKLNYAYVVNPDYNPTYYFLDTEVKDYLNEDLDDIDKEISTLYVETFRGYVDDIYFEYKYNSYRETGVEYYSDEYYGDVIYSETGGKIKISAPSLQMYTYKAGKKYI